MAQDKPQAGVAFCGPKGVGKSTLLGHLLYLCGGIAQRTMEKFHAMAQGQTGFAGHGFPLIMDSARREEKVGGFSRTFHVKQLFTAASELALIDTPGSPKYLRNAIKGLMLADAMVLVVPGDASFEDSVAIGTAHCSQTGSVRQFIRVYQAMQLQHLLCVVTKLDTVSRPPPQERFEHIKQKLREVLCEEGFRPKFVSTRVPILPVSPIKGDNIIQRGVLFPWWKGCSVRRSAQATDERVTTLLDALDAMPEPNRDVDLLPLRIKVYQSDYIKGIGTVLSARVLQGCLKCGMDLMYASSLVVTPLDTLSPSCTGNGVGSAHSLERFHRNVMSAVRGCPVGIHFRGPGRGRGSFLVAGDTLAVPGDQHLSHCHSFTARVRLFKHPNVLRVGFVPLCCVQNSSAPCRVQKLLWRKGKGRSDAPHFGGGDPERTEAKHKEAAAAAGQQVTVEETLPLSLRTGDIADVVFAPQRPLVLDTVQRCAPLGRVLFLEQGGVIMVGQVKSVQTQFHHYTSQVAAYVSSVLPIPGLPEVVVSYLYHAAANGTEQ